jgi:acetyl-CoA carboxylase biotin carboxyl carrier protein
LQSFLGACNLARSARRGRRGAAAARRDARPEPRLSHDHLTYDDLLRIVELIKTSEQFSEFRLKIGDIEVELRRRTAAAPSASAPTATSPTVAPPASAPPVTLEPSSRETPAWPDGSVVIRAPMVGTFYRAPQPGAPPFVDVGSAVDDHTTVCIIEVMKLMNSISAGVRGTVTHVLVGDATPVETGEPLIVVQPELPAP